MMFVKRFKSLLRNTTIIGPNNNVLRHNFCIEHKKCHIHISFKKPNVNYF